MSATHRSWHIEAVCTAIRTAFPGVPPQRLLHAAYAVQHEETIVPVGVEGRADTKMEEEIDASIQAVEPEPLEDVDAIEVLATWKQTREAMTKEKLDRGAKGRPPSSPSRQELDRLASRTRCFRC